MKAILFAAGKGTRLGRITKERPKCLIDVGGVAMLDHWIEKLHALGVCKFLINTHYLADVVEAHLDMHPMKEKFIIVREDKLLGTAGTLQRNLEFCNTDTFLIHVDNFCQDDLVRFFKSHFTRPKGTILSMLTFETDTPEQCGIVKTDRFGIMQSFLEKSNEPNGRLANGAVFIGSKEFFEYVGTLPKKTDLSKEIISLMVGRVFCIKTDKFFIDVGTPDNLAAAQKVIEGYAK